MSVRVCILISLIIIQYYGHSVTGNGCDCTLIITDLEKFENHVLKRRTRSVVFPNKANLLVTPAFTKAVLDGRPRGLSYSVEFDMYSPLPDTIEGWQPTVLATKLKQQQETSTTAANNVSSNILENKFHYLHDDGGDYYEFPVHETENLNNLTHIESEWNVGQKYFYGKSHSSNIRENRKEFVYPNQFHKLPFMRGRNRNNVEFGGDSHNLYPQINWHLHHPLDQSYRERRQLFEQLETVGKIFRFNTKACIKRAMCEITNNLRPYGESLVEDIIRLTLTDYRQNYDNIKCEQYFALSCPYRVLEFLTKTIKNNFN